MRGAFPVVPNTVTFPVTSGHRSPLYITRPKSLDTMESVGNGTFVHSGTVGLCYTGLAVGTLILYVTILALFI